MTKLKKDIIKAAKAQVICGVRLNRALWAWERATRLNKDKAWKEVLSARDELADAVAYLTDRLKAFNAQEAEV